MDENVVNVPKSKLSKLREPPIHEPLKHGRLRLQSEWHACKLVSLPPGRKCSQAPILDWHTDAEECVLQIET